jgi:transcriptional regulator with GAF, ATPase, and Fis domain
MDREPWLHVWGKGEPCDRKVLLECLAAAGIRPRSLESGAARGDGILWVAQLDEDVGEFLREHTRNHGRVLVLHAADAAADSARVWQLLHAGASDLLTWSSAAAVAERIKARFARWHAVDALMQSEAITGKLVGVSAAWRAALRQIIEIARFTSGYVLLIGESGTGKELLARLFHELDSNATASELVVVDCTTIVPELSGSEFFGHERGAFTGAVAMRDGAFAAADGGVLFLDEVGELPMPLQAQLLRVIQEGTYKRVGGNAWRHAEFRLVSATNKNLVEAIAGGHFRNDLYYRIASWVIRVPSLQERREDILPLARHFLRVFRPDIPELDFEPAVRGFLSTRVYPGNVRDLRHLVARIASRHVGPGPITVGDVPVDEYPAVGAGDGRWLNADFEQAIRHAVDIGAGLKEISQAAAETAMRIAIDNENGSLQLAAQRLGVTDRALQMRRAARRKHDGNHHDAN